LVPKKAEKRADSFTVCPTTIRCNKSFVSAGALLRFRPDSALSIDYLVSVEKRKPQNENNAMVLCVHHLVLGRVCQIKAAGKFLNDSPLSHFDGGLQSEIPGRVNWAARGLRDLDLRGLDLREGEWFFRKSVFGQAGFSKCFSSKCFSSKCV
jgi:hypothetical protein